MRMRARVRAALVAVAVLVAALPAGAQELRGAVEGVVKDSSGGVLPGATVEARNMATNAVLTAVTDSNGIYRFPAMQPGTYDITATLSGFQAAKATGVRVNLGELLKADLILNIAGMAETVQVRGETPVVDVKQNAVTATISQDIIDLIPKGRSLLSVITGVAGTGNETRGGLTIDGAGAAEHRYVIDGLDTTNLRNGTSGSTIAPDFIDQIQVKQSGYNAEYRAATGGVISAITKSGTNNYHGGAGLYVTGRPMRGMLGDPRPTLRLAPANQNVAEYFTAPRLNETEGYEQVWDIGGPVLRDRAWFFLGFNPSYNQTVRTVTWTNPGAFTPTQTFDSKSKNTVYNYNVSYQMRSDLRFRLAGSNTRSDLGLGLPAIDSTNSTSTSNPSLFNPRPTTYTHQYENTYSLSTDWVASSRFYANVTAGYYFDGSGSRGGDYYRGTRRTFATTNVNLLDVPASLQQVSGFADNPVNSFTIKDDYSRKFLNVDATIFRDWFGQHAFKIGTQVEQLGNDTNSGQQFPNITFQWDSSRSTLDARVVRGRYGFYSVVRSYTLGDITAKNFGIFLQDQWTVNSKLTVNYGVRSERTHIPSYRPENPSLTFGWSTQIAPRLGFAYDVKGDGRWKTYGSFGTFFDTPKLEMPRGLWGAENILTYYYTLDTFNWPSIDCTGAPGTGCPGTFIEQVDSRHVANDPLNNLVDPNLKPVQTREFSIGMDHELSRTTSIGLRYVHKWFVTTIEDTGVQVPGIGEVFYIANPGDGFGAFPLGTDYPRTPYPQRDYDGFDITFKRRLSNNWFMNTNLLISRLYGSYSGLTSTDEGSRNSPNVNRFYDGLYMSFDAQRNAVYGRLQNDRPFQFKLQGGYITPWGTQVGVNYTAGSGYLNSTTVTYKSVPVFVNGRGDLGRSPTLSQTDLNFTHSFRLPRNAKVNLSLNVDNLFDQATWTTLFTTQYRDALTLPRVCRSSTDITCDDYFFNGFNVITEMANRRTSTGALSPGRPDDRYKKPSAFLGARTARFLVKFVF